MYPLSVRMNLDDGIRHQLQLAQNIDDITDSLPSLIGTIDEKAISNNMAAPMNQNNSIDQSDDVSSRYVRSASSVHSVTV